MDYIGIEIRKDSWEITLIEAGLFGVKVKDCIRMQGVSDATNIAELRKLVGGKNPKDYRVAIGLPREQTIAKVVKIPVPAQDALEGILKFELEKHIPFPIEEAYYGFMVLERKHNISTIFFEAAKKSIVDGLINLFRTDGLEIFSVSGNRAGLYNGLCELDRLPKDKGTAFLQAYNSGLTIDTFINSIPLDSRTIKSRDEGVNSIKTGLRILQFSLEEGQKLDGISVLSGSADDETLRRIKESFDKPLTIESSFSFEGQPIKGLTSLGLALNALGKGDFALNILQVSKATENPGRITLMLAGAVFFLCVLIGGSFVVKDKLALLRLESAISGLEGNASGSKKAMMNLKSMDDRIRTLEEIELTASKSLEALKGLAIVMPKGTRFTDLEYHNDEIALKGLSDQATNLLILLERSSYIKDVEFTGPIIKTDQGKESFGLKGRLKDA